MPEQGKEELPRFGYAQSSQEGRSPVRSVIRTTQTIWVAALLSATTHLLPIASAQDVGALQQQVRSLVAEGKHAQAVAMLRTTIDQYPHALDLHLLYQDLQLQVGDREKLLAEYAARLKQSPDDNDLRYLHARLLLGKKALTELRKLTKSAPGHARGWAAYARALRESGRLKDALKAAEKSVSLGAQFPETHMELGAALEEMGEAEPAEREYREAIKRDRWWMNARYRLALLLAVEKRGEDALIELEKAAKLAPREPRVSIHKGLVLAEIGQHKQAVEAYKAAVQLSPKDAFLLVLLAESHAELEQWKDAATAIERALELEPKFAGAHAARGFVSFQQGDHKTARKAYREANKFDPSNADYLFRLGLIEEMNDDPKKAAKYYKSAASKDKSSALYLLALGAVYEKSGQSQKALSTYKSATAVEPKNVDAWTRYGYTAIDAKKPKAAADALQKALDLDPTDVDLMLSLGILYETELNRKSDAIDMYNRYLKAGGKDERVKDWRDALDD